MAVGGAPSHVLPRTLLGISIGYQYKQNVHFQKIPIARLRGILKAKVFKIKCEAKLEFLQVGGWGGWFKLKTILQERYGDFLEQHNDIVR